MTTIITCPSGLSGKVRGLKVSEQRIFTDKKLAKNGQQFSELLKACWLETLDPGPYGEGFSLDDALVGDRFFALLQIRKLTYGPDIELKLRCPVAKCEHSFVWEVGVDALPVKALPEKSRARIAAKTPFPFVLPDAGVPIEFQLLTGRHEIELERAKRRDSDPLTEVLLKRIVSITGVDPKAHRAFIDDLGLGDVAALRDAVEEADCGVETSIEAECPECGHIMGLELPLEAILMPKTSKKRTTASTEASPAR